MRTLSDAEAYLDGFLNRERGGSFDYEKTGLSRIRALLRALDDPHHSLPSIHVTGSNGKGTVALACERLLGATGLRVGTYTSPHLESWIERFRVAGRVVSAEVFLERLRRALPAIERLRADPELAPSFFDVTTALAFDVFRAEGAEAGVIEVGLGGRLDSTNVVHSRVSVLTAVQLEHTDKLGGTLAAIAREKAGILRPKGQLVHGPLPAEAAQVVDECATSLDVECEEVRAQGATLDLSGVRFEVVRPDATGVEIRAAVLGRVQAQNLAIALRACERFVGRPLVRSEYAALADLVLPGRIERFGDVVLDSAHTREAASALRDTLETLWPGRRWLLGISISRDKDADAVLAELAPLVRACVVTRAEPTRSCEPGELALRVRALGIGEVQVEPEPRVALERLRSLRAEDEGILIAGSFYLAGALRAALCATSSGV